MIVAPTTAIDARGTADNHNMLWWQDESGGWVTSDADAVRWNRDHIIQCASATFPRVVRGEIIPGERCKNVMKVGYPKWWIAPGNEIPVGLCWAHAKSEAAVAAAIAQVRGAA